MLEANSRQTFSGRLPVFLHGVVVLRVEIDRDGMPANILTMRVPEHAPELGPQAVAAVHRGAPYPRPSAALLAGAGSMHVIETWLFRDDGHFQVRTFAGPQ